MHIGLKIILKLLLKKGDIRKLTEIVCHRIEAWKRVVGLQKAELFVFDQVAEYKFYQQGLCWMELVT